MITAKQIKAARALIDWSQQDLADQCEMSKTAIANIESGQSRPTDRNMTNILNAFDRAGVEFIDSGVREKLNLIRVLDDNNAIIEFFDDVYLNVKEYGGEILISGVDEQVFHAALGNSLSYHIERMQKLGNYICQVLIKESDENPNAVAYAEYRKIPDQYFSNVPFYIYANKIAIILWNRPTKIILLDDKDMADAYRKHFKVLWNTVAK